MAANVNQVTISGRLTRDPELRSTTGGTPLMTFSVACNERRKNAQGEWEDAANFFDCVIYGKQAEWLSQDLRKSKMVTVQGRLKQSTWEREGQRRSKVEIVADVIDYERPPREQSGYQQSGYQQARPGRGQQTAYFDQRPMQQRDDLAQSEDIPF